MGVETVGTELAVVDPEVALELAGASVTWEIEVTGYSVLEPLRMTSAAPPVATWEESTAVTTPTVAGLPLVPGIVTWAPISEPAVLMFEFWSNSPVCWRLVN